MKEGWSTSLALSLIDYQLRNSTGTYHPIPLSPSINIDGAITWQNRSLGLTTEVWGSLIGPQDLPFEINGKTTSPTYGLVNLRLEKDLGSFALFTGMLNALNAQQNESTPLVLTTGAIPDGSIGWGPTEGREFFVGARMRLMWDNE